MIPQKWSRLVTCYHVSVFYLWWCRNINSPVAENWTHATVLTAVNLWHIQNMILLLHTWLNTSNSDDTDLITTGKKKQRSMCWISFLGPRRIIDDTMFTCFLFFSRHSHLCFCNIYGSFVSYVVFSLELTQIVAQKKKEFTQINI